MDYGFVIDVDDESNRSHGNEDNSIENSNHEAKLPLKSQLCLSGSLLRRRGQSNENHENSRVSKRG